MIKIKSLFNILFCLGLVHTITSCNNKEAIKTSKQESFVNTLTAADTTTVLNLAAQCMDLLKGNHVEEALQMMYSMTENKLVPISEEQKQQLNGKFRMFPVLQYDLDGYNFASETNNVIKYKIEFFPHKDQNDKTPNTIGFMFVPVHIDGKWHLTVPKTN
ncbi:hypothetical protein AAE250_22135 [Bacteroides sp. GD17]|jgi:hypothetical protein|uniref:hypothetical protein n=1 Tax=Bacteroides sp. GD17 TaxID=3139826 RepID=UPI0025F2E869|nr:hypothetical protein [uncultured Bacteroides sp.]